MLKFLQNKVWKPFYDKVLTPAYNKIWMPFYNNVLIPAYNKIWMPFYNNVLKPVLNFFAKAVSPVYRKMRNLWEERKVNKLAKQVLHVENIRLTLDLTVDADRRRIISDRFSKALMEAKKTVQEINPKYLENTPALNQLICKLDLVQNFDNQDANFDEGDFELFDRSIQEEIAAKARQNSRDQNPLELYLNNENVRPIVTVFNGVVDDMSAFVGDISAWFVGDKDWSGNDSEEKAKKAHEEQEISANNADNKKRDLFLDNLFN
jgi:hypothetical protein